jgi:hypothetical protein
MLLAQLALAVVSAVVLITGALGAPYPNGTMAAFGFVLLALGMARAMRYGGFGAAAGTPISRAAVESDGWRKDTFVMGGLEADGEALQEFTDEAGIYGYRREPGADRYSWRFTREPRA